MTRLSLMAVSQLRRNQYEGGAVQVWTKLLRPKWHVI